MGQPKIFVDVASVDHREELVAEVFIDNSQWCELSQDDGKLELTFFSREQVSLDFHVAMELLDHIKNYLADGNYVHNRPEWHDFGQE